LSRTDFQENPSMGAKIRSWKS